MARFLYMFGYEDPLDEESNATVGTDFESCAGLLIEAPSSSDALIWGREVSQGSFVWLFQRHGQPGPDWKSQEFANWLEPEDSEAWQSFRDAPTVEVGQMPPFESLLPPMIARDK